MVPLNPYPQDVNPDELSYAGAPIPSKKALQIALGNVNIYSGEIFASFNPDTFVVRIYLCFVAFYFNVIFSLSISKKKSSYCDR